ncbi:MAG: 23S rRNA (uracil(1939)-C(5))-methyltransferase RlmD [Deltaproteobacteria bacterium]|jgi:23S rRNA (uracil1939-C5)-methyltransferase|nr:23S rRNA (uracil(1939)-C(5))-methyltransferase RlmD [Deltaproteobacteria bacterium]
MSVKKGQELKLEISGLAFGGKGIARKDGFTVFVDHTVPLDIVVARIIKKKKNFAVASVIEILEKSPFRTDPPCIYSGQCGGCKWQFLKYDKQLDYKRQHVIDSLEHIGMIKGVTVHSSIPSKLIYGYRNKMEFSCSDRRWLMPDEMGMENPDLNFALGLHVPGTFHKVLDTKKCLLQPALGNNILDDVRIYIKESNVPVYGLRSHIGFWRFVMLRHSAAYDQWMVNIVTAEESNKIVKPLSDLLTAKYPEIVSVINNINTRKAGIAVGEYEILLAGSPFIKEKIALFEFKISANSFFQTNTSGAEILYEKVKEYAGLSGKEYVVDLYSGAGTIAIFLADSAKELTGIEISKSAVQDAEANCLYNGISNCRFILGDIKDCLEHVKKLDVMIIDPPRTGMHKNVVKQILDMAPAKIIYVSCNPATMARDLGMMKDNYKVLEVQPVDMFPHTYHIESVARLERK